jgi:Carboxypeptidase regulatory-like domain
MRMICRARWGSLLAAMLAALCAQTAVAQAVRATATDAATGAPVAEVLVRVLAADGETAAAGFTRADGTVVLRLREGGTYRVRAERTGYQDRTVPDVAVGPAGEVPLVLRMEHRPFAIDTVTVIARSEDERGRDGFERRRAMGLGGVFLDSAYVAQRSGRVAFAGDLLRGVPGMYVRRRGIGESVPFSDRGWRCMVMLLDGRPVQLVFRDGGRRELHHIIGPRDVVAVEVFRQFSEVPPEFRQYARRGMYNCGVYLYWTSVRW